jgi:hypothetical protein
MSDLILPPGYQRQNVKMTEKLCVLIHHDTKRILCFCFDDAFTHNFTQRGYEKVSIRHAHEYDKYAKQLREQTNFDNQVEDLAYLEREDRTRKKLRADLRARLSWAKSGPERQVIESAIRTLDAMQERKKRIRAESFMVMEAAEEGKVDGESMVRKLICEK